MKAQMQNVLEFVTENIAAIFVSLTLASMMLLGFAAVASIPAAAQSAPWKVDGEHSVARLYLGSGDKATEIGVARVNGTVAYDADGSDPVVNLIIAAGSGADDPQIGFHSKRSMLTSDGKLAVIGDLSVSRTSRSVTLDANDGYYGATYGEPVVSTEKREVTLLLPAELRPAVQNGTPEIVASTNISREYFPALIAALSPGNFPGVIVQDENCSVPFTLGVDYSGAVCTGTPVSIATNNAPSALPAGGEGYYGSEPAATLDHGQATIALDLKLASASQQSAPVPAMSAGN